MGTLHHQPVYVPDSSRDLDLWDDGSNFLALFWYRTVAYHVGGGPQDTETRCQEDFLCVEYQTHLDLQVGRSTLDLAENDKVCR